MESFYSKYKSFNWDEIIRDRLTSYRNAARDGRKESFNDYSDSQKYCYLETQQVHLSTKRDHNTRVKAPRGKPVENISVVTTYA